MILFCRLHISLASQSSSPSPSHVIVLRRSLASYKLSITGYQLPCVFCWLSPPKEGVTFLPLTACPYARLLKKTDFDEIFWRGGTLPKDFDEIFWRGGTLPKETFKGFFIYCCNSCSRPKIKRESPWQKFELGVSLCCCFVVHST